MSIGRLVRRVIKKFGQEIVRRPRIETVTENGQIEYTYGEPRTVFAQVTMLTGYAEIFEVPGVRIRADALATFTPETEIEVGDLVKIDSEWYEVAEKILRKTRGKVDFIECLLRRRQ